MADFIGKVISLDDKLGGNRIKVWINPYDKYKSNSELPYAVPWIPMFLQFKPKVGEAVRIICQDDDPNKQRYYVGPVISQPQNMWKESYSFSNTTTDNAMLSPSTSVNDIAKANGAYAADDEVAFYGRKNSDIIMSDNDLRVRCGARIANVSDPTDVAFNKTSPSFLKLTYHESPLNVTNSVTGEEKTVNSTATLVADEINLISNVGDPYINTGNPNSKSISDNELKKIIEKAHALPYGDVLVDFLNLFLNAFANHTHNYNNLPPVPDSTYNQLMSYDMKEILSKHIHIN